MANFEGTELEAIFRCRQCGLLLRDHVHVDVGPAAAGSREVERIAEAIELANWEKLSFLHGVPPEDSIVFRITRCPPGDGFVIALAYCRGPVRDKHLDGSVRKLGADAIEAMRAVAGEWTPALRDLA
jgi:hypothetical protein